MAKIKFNNGKVVNFNGTPTPQDVEEVARSLGISGTPTTPTNADQQQVTKPVEAPKPSSVEDYATKEGQTTVLAPAKALSSDRGPVGGAVADTGRMALNTLSDAYHIGKGLTYDTAKTIFHDIPVAGYNLIKEQGLLNAVKNTITSIPSAVGDTLWGLVPESAKQIAGKEQWMSAVENWNEVLKQNNGDYSKTFGAIISSVPESIPDALKNELENIDRARIAVVDHPLSEVLGYMGLKGLVHGIVNPAEGMSMLREGRKSISSAKDAIVDLAKNPGDNPFSRTWKAARTAYEETSKNHILDKAVKNGQEGLSTINDLKGINEKIDSVPKFGTEYENLLRQRDDLLAKSDKVKNEIENDLKINTNVIKESVNQNTFADTAEAGNGIIEIAKESKDGTKNLYNQNFVTKDGAPIKVDPEPVIKPLEELMDKASGSMERSVFEKLKGFYADFVVRTLLNKHGGDKWMITPEDIAPYKKYLPEKFYEDAGGDFGAIAKQKGIDTTAVNHNAFGDPYYQQPITANVVKNIRNNIHDSLGNNGELLKAFDSTVKSSMNELLEREVSKVNPEGWKQIVKADENYQKIRESKVTSSALKDGINPSTVVKNAFTNWNQFVADYAKMPEVIDKMRNLKAKEILESSQLPDGSIKNVGKYQKLLEENRDILGNQLYNKLSSIKDGYDSLAQFDEVTKSKDTAIKETIDSTKKKANIIGDNIESSILKVKSVDELNSLAETANLKPVDLGDIAAARLLKKHGFEFDEKGNISNTSKLTESNITDIVKEWQKIGGDFPGEVQAKMFSPALKEVFSKLSKASEDLKRAEGVANKNVAMRLAEGAMAAFTFASGHYILGSGFLASSIKPSKVPRAKKIEIKIGGETTPQTVKKPSGAKKLIVPSIVGGSMDNED